MKLKPHVWLLAVLSIVLCLPPEVRAQTTTSGGLMGVVTDPSNSVVPDASVEIKDNAKGTTQAAKTDQDGMFRFFFLTPGRYTLRVARDGFREENRTVNVLLGPPVTVNVTLEIVRAGTTVTVTAEAPLIHAENGDVATTINQNQISEVPNPGNDLTYIAQTAPGAVMNTDNPFGNSQFAILGMPSTSNLFVVDGMNENDNGTNATLPGPLGLLLGQNELQEATVISTGYSGQFGGAAGANVNYITKSGSNEFHGNAQYFWNGRLLNANDWFNNAFGTPRPFDNANQWATSLGGPIKKDKLFFFLDSEGLRLLIPFATFLMTVPSPQFEAATIANIDSRFGAASASNAFYKKIFDLYNAAPGASSAAPGGFNPGDPTGCTGFTLLGAGVPCAMHFLSTRGRRSAETLTSGRVDWNVSTKDLAFLRLQYDPGVGAFLADPISSAFDVDTNMRRWQGELMETHTFSPSAASQFLLAGTYFSRRFGVKNTSQALSTFPTFLQFSATGTFSSLGGFDLGSFAGGRDYTHYQLSEDFVKTASKHKLGIGGQFARHYWSQLPDTFAAVGGLFPQSLDAFYQGGVDPASPTADFTELFQSFNTQSIRKLSFLNFALYGQDEWHARPNLILTAALRVEYYSNPLCRNRCFARLAGPFEAVSHDPSQPYNQAILINQRYAVQSTDGVLWSPRLSFAWQPFGVSHNSVLRAGVGVFYDPLPGFILDGFSTNAPIENFYTISGDNLAPDEKTSLFKDTAASNAAFLNGFAAGQTLAQIQAAIPNFSPPAMGTAARRMHSPQFQRWSLEWQQAFRADTSVSIGYFGHHGIHELVQNPNANAFGFGSLPRGLCSSPPVPPCADPRFSGVTQSNTDAVSNYNGMVASIKHQFTRWTRGSFQANYTYSHAFDETSNGGFLPFTFVSSASPQDPNNLRGAYGPAEYDARHSFNASYVLEVPIKTVLRRRGPDSLVRGWQISGTIFARTGLPYTVFDGAESNFLNQNNYFGMLYAVPVGPFGSANPCGEGAALPLVPNPCQPPEVLANGSPNPQAKFVQTDCETGFDRGNLPGPNGPCSGPAVSFAQGRNHFRGPHYWNTDFAIMKNTKVPRWENAELGLGFQFFNFFNHPNFGFPDNFSSDAIFGQIQYLEASPTGILGSGIGGDLAPRMIQLKAQLRF